MNRWMAGGAGGVLSAGLLLALAVPGLAQEEPEYEEFQREADFVPGEPRPGEQTTASDDTCHEGTTDLWWALQPVAGGEVVDSGLVPLDAGGGWEATFPAPDEPGEYRFFALCLPPGSHELEMGAAIIDRIMEEDVPVEILEDWGVSSLTYYAMLLPVAPDETPTTEPPAPTTPTTQPPASIGEPADGRAPAATPVPATPTFTG